MYAVISLLCFCEVLIIGASLSESSMQLRVVDHVQTTTVTEKNGKFAVVNHATVK